MKFSEMIDRLKNVHWPLEQGCVVVAVIQSREHDGRGCRMTAIETRVSGIAVRVENDQAAPNILLECALVERNDGPSSYSPADLYKDCLRVGKKYRGWTVDVGLNLLPAGGAHKVGVRTDHRVVMCGCRDTDKTIAFLIDPPPRDWFDRLLSGADSNSVVKVNVDSTRKAAEAGDAVAQNELGIRYADGVEVRKNERLAVLWFRKAAEKGYAEAQFNLGWRCEAGLGVAQNIAEAIAWYRLSTKQGVAAAQNNLGWMYLMGKGVRKNYVRALDLMVKAAEQGFAYSQRNLGWMYDVGKGVAQDSSEAVKWYRMAAEQGDADAQCRLGKCFVLGKGVRKNRTYAQKWFCKAAEQGFAEAQYFLGCALLDRPGGGRDRRKAEAVAWLKRAAAQGHEEARKELNALGVIMDGEN